MILPCWEFLGCFVQAVSSHQGLKSRGCISLSAKKNLLCTYYVPGCDEHWSWLACVYRQLWWPLKDGLEAGDHYRPLWRSKPVILKLEWASESPGGLFKNTFSWVSSSEFLMCKVWIWGSEKFAFLTTSQVMLKLLVGRPLLENRWSRQKTSTGKHKDAGTHQGWWGGLVLNKVLRVEWTGNGGDGARGTLGLGSLWVWLLGLLVAGFCIPLGSCWPTNFRGEEEVPASVGWPYLLEPSVQLSWQGFPVWSLSLSLCVFKRKSIFLMPFYSSRDAGRWDARVPFRKSARSVYWISVPDHLMCGDRGSGCCLDSWGTLCLFCFPYGKTAGSCSAVGPWVPRL